MYPFKVSLKFFHPDIDPDYICEKIGMEAGIKWKAGAKRRTPKGAPLEGVYHETYCYFDLKRSKRIALSDYLARWNRKLNKHKDFFKTIRSTGGRIYYHIAWFPEPNKDFGYGDVFDFELLNQMVNLGIEFDIAVYCPRKDELLAIKERKKKK